MHNQTVKMSQVAAINYEPLWGGSHLSRQLSETDLLLAYHLLPQ
jgi:hypothetical protein